MDAEEKRTDEQSPEEEPEEMTIGLPRDLEEEPEEMSGGLPREPEDSGTQGPEAGTEEDGQTHGEKAEQEQAEDGSEALPPEAEKTVTAEKKHRLPAGSVPVRIGVALVLAALLFLLGRSGRELQILTQPKDAAGNPGDTLRFTLAADGSGLSYQWQFRAGESGEWKDCSSEGSNTLLLTVEAEAYRSGYQYRCAVTDGKETVYSEPATLLVIGKPEIILQPENTEVKVGDTARFSFGVYGTDLKYQWQYRTGSKAAWKDCTTEGCNSPTLTVAAEEHRDGYQYRCIAANQIDSVSSRTAKLTVYSKPEIKTQPQDAAAKLGDSVTFTVKASGSGIRYQWQYRANKDGKWKDCGAKGCDSPSFTVKAEEHRNGYQYRCRVENGFDTLYTQVVSLRIGEKPVITAQPKSVTAKEGETVRFSVTASGSGLSYQWQYRAGKDGKWKDSSASGCKTETLSITAEAHRDGYQYRCAVSGGGTVYSEVASLTVGKG